MNPHLQKAHAILDVALLLLQQEHAGRKGQQSKKAVPTQLNSDLLYSNYYCWHRVSAHVWKCTTHH